MLFNFIILMLFFMQPTVTTCSGQDNNSEKIPPLMNAKTLKNTKMVRTLMLARRFKEVTFPTPDEQTIHAYFLDRSKRKTPTQTVIFAAGFDPGRKEGMAAFAHLFEEQPYNMLFFDARGHGNSTGPSHWHPRGLSTYGTVEHQDVIGAIEYVHRYNHENDIPQDIYLHGICAGAFHSINALWHLEQNPQHSHLTQAVKGVIADSSWNQLTDIANHAIHTGSHKQAHPYVAPLVSLTLRTVYNYSFRLPHWWYNHPLEKKLPQVKTPIFFIHHTEDKLSPHAHMQSVIKRLKKKKPKGHIREWTVQETTSELTRQEKRSLHGNIHLVAPTEYRDRVRSFIKKISDQ
jgi:pimeloyl-ACP methyl ester carboxylesterase